MANFYSVLGFLAVNAFDYSEPGHFDMLSLLPLEMAIAILRLLPAKDLLSAACVSTKWMRILKSDVTLRQKIRRHFRQLRTLRLARVINDNAGRNVTRRPSIRPTMKHISNTVSNDVPRCCRVHVLPPVERESRYMPYRRDHFIRQQKKRSSDVRDEDQQPSGRCNARLRM